ncbi:probable inactive peptidyl-prolyl cis-trans isomerase-like 6 [Gigantopelta aegis]|uniref:probable inactive peptidyl-prolyl cis-trans isomerase-like 6 n=1 Tax=Gigantopelta aegis TaxID=1735272 RepID=UPI001B8894F3|nr:probable inactive peptidyl-prolyl cis-trans isomerase-like 6 [Gigantopelta aegis]
MVLNVVLHRIVPHGWIQGGDICGGSGSSGMSIYGPTFADECFAVSHDSRGILGMVNHGLNTNNSQFYITLAPAKWMDRLMLPLGKRVIEGTRILENLEMVDTYNEPTDQTMYDN